MIRCNDAKATYSPPISDGVVVSESMRSVPFELPKTLGKHPKVRILSSPLAF